METFKLRAHVGEDGVLKLELPVGVRDVDCEVVVVYAVPSEPDRQEWAAFIDSTYGSLADDPIERGDQGEPEVRDAIL